MAPSIRGGNLWAWDEEILTGAARELRGGGYINNPDFLAASSQGAQGATGESRDIGFRVASLGAAPAVPSMNPIGIALLSSLLGLVSWRKIRAQRYA